MNECPIVYCFMMYRTQLEKQSVSAGPQSETTPTDSIHLEAAGRISQLEDKLERANSTCKDLQNQVHITVCCVCCIVEQSCYILQSRETHNSVPL